MTLFVAEEAGIRPLEDCDDDGEDAGLCLLMVTVDDDVEEEEEVKVLIVDDKFAFVDCIRLLL
jgi:hypothetical protein